MSGVIIRVAGFLKTALHWDQTDPILYWDSGLAWDGFN
jgi:hypothetical protein